MKNTSSISDEQYSLIKERILAAAHDNRITCSGAFAIAKALKAPTSEVGRMADKLNIKISKCQLGCF